MSDREFKRPAGEWEVVAGNAHNPGNPHDGAQEAVLARAPEAEARRVYADTVADAASAGYAYVKLRNRGREIDAWPPATGWTS